MILEMKRAIDEKMKKAAIVLFLAVVCVFANFAAYAHTHKDGHQHDDCALCLFVRAAKTSSAPTADILKVFFVFLFAFVFSRLIFPKFSTPSFSSRSPPSDKFFFQIH